MSLSVRSTSPRPSFVGGVDSKQREWKNLTALRSRQLERRALRQAPAVAPLVGFGDVERVVDARPVLLGQFIRVALELQVPC